MKSSIILIFLDLAAAADIMTCLDNSYREKRWVKLGYWIGIDISCRSRRQLQKSGVFRNKKQRGFE